MKFLACCALLVLLPLTAAAQQSPSETAPGAASRVDRQAEAYANYVLGHINQVQYEDTGDQNYAAQAIDYYKKALALNPDGVEIRLQMAGTYAESGQLRDAIAIAQDVLKSHPNNIDAHRLLARIYVRTLGELGPQTNQKETLALAVQQYEAILNLDPSDNEAGLWLARLYRFQNQSDKAGKVLQQMLAQNPSNQQAIGQYAQLLLDQGHAHQAIALLTKSAGGAGSASLYDLLGNAYVQVQDSANAEKAYRRAVQLDPGNPVPLRRLAGTLFDESKFDEAIPAYQRLAGLDPSDPTNYLRLAEIYYQQKKYDLAETNIALAEQRAPGSLEVVYNQALIDEALGKFGDAVDVLSSAIAHLKQQAATPAAGAAPNPGVYAILYEELGHIYRQQGDYAAAINTFKEMMSLGPEQVRRGRIELIETYRENSQIDDAIATARQAMQADPQDRRMKITYAFLLGDKEETDNAVKTLRSLLDGSPADWKTHLDIAQVELRGRRYADAKRSADTAESMAQGPKQKSEAWFLLGAIYERQKQYGPAEKQFRKVLAVNPDDAETLNYYGYMLAEQGVRLDQAAALVKRALAIDSGNSAYLDSLGWVYFKQNRLIDARNYILQAIARRPNDPTILGHLGDVYQGLGETDLALATWEKALVQWRRVSPADYEPDLVREIERKVSETKSRSKQKNHADAVISH